MKEIDFIPDEYVTRSVSFHRDSSFTAYLNTILDPFIVEGLVDEYKLGVTKDGAVIFFQIDEEGRCRSGKVMKYDPVTGHRIRDGRSACRITWVHVLMKQQGLLHEEWDLSQCLFGEHLLQRYPCKTVALVESEKTAVICAGLLPEYVWLATGGKNNLGKKLDCLAYRKVVVYPDVDAYDYWCEQLAEYSNIRVSDLLQRVKGPGDEKMDLADWLLTNLGQPEPISVTFQRIAQFFSSEYHTEINALMNDFDLVPLV